MLTFELRRAIARLALEGKPVDRPNTTLPRANRAPNQKTRFMRHRLVSIMIIQCLVVVVLMSRATADEAADTREAVQRTQAEKDFVLDQMRLFLTSIVGVEEGLGSGDMDQVAREAAARGRKANAALARPPALGAKESDAWKSMIGSVRSGFDQIADEAIARAPAAKINKTLAETMTSCVACHQTYRIAVEAR